MIRSQSLGGSDAVCALSTQSAGMAYSSLATHSTQGRSASGVRGFAAFAVQQPRLPIEEQGRTLMARSLRVNDVSVSLQDVTGEKVLPELSSLRVIRTPCFGMWKGLKHSERFNCVAAQVVSIKGLAA